MQRVLRLLEVDNPRVLDLLLLVHNMDNSFLTPLAFTSCLDGTFTRERAIPWNILPFSFFFNSYDLTRHVHTCIHGRT